MNQFREGKLELLIATDVASRGLDVDHVDLIIHDDLPMTKKFMSIELEELEEREGTVKHYFAGSRAKNRLKQLENPEMKFMISRRQQKKMDAMLYDSVDELMEAKPNPLSEDILMHFIEWFRSP